MCCRVEYTSDGLSVHPVSFIASSLPSILPSTILTSIPLLPASSVLPSVLPLLDEILILQICCKHGTGEVLN